jgi:Protein of unknown function (DUF4231)
MDPVTVSLNAEQYIAERLKQYKDWYDKKAVRHKALYLRMKASSVIGGAIVPVLVNIDNPTWTFQGISPIKLVVTLISLMVVIFVALESVFHYREQWKNYRSTAEQLERERLMFQTRVGHYGSLDDSAAFRLLVERVEEAIAAENAATLNVMTTSIETTDALRSVDSKS